MTDPSVSHHLSPTSQSTAPMANTHTPYLPNEVLSEIASHVDDADIPNLRLSAKVFHYITADRFARVFFQDRAYHLSPAGLKALVKITEHPVFAPYIRTVVIGHGGKTHSAKYHDNIQSAFENLKIHGNAISLGVRRVRTAHNFEPIASRAGNGMSRFLHKMLAAATQTQMPLESVIADLQSPPVDGPAEPGEWWFQLTHRAYWTTKTDTLHIRLPPRDPRSGTPSQISFDHSKYRLALVKISTPSMVLIPGSFSFFAKKIQLSDCETSQYWALHMLIHSRRLEHLSLLNVRLVSRPGFRDTWGEVFRELSRIQHFTLKSCEFGELWDGQGSPWLEGGEKTIRANTQAQVRTVLLNLADGIKEFSLDDPDHSGRQ